MADRQGAKENENELLIREADRWTLLHLGNKYTKLECDEAARELWASEHITLSISCQHTPYFVPFFKPRKALEE